MATELTVQAGMRIASLAVFSYDFLITIPSEVRLYKRQHSIFRPSISCVLFALIRYVCLFYIIWVTFVFFGTSFSLAACGRVAPVGAVSRSLLSSLSAAIFVWRTWVIWGRSRLILGVMLVTLIPVTVFSYVPGFIQTPVISASGGCTAVSRGGGPLSQKWTFALVNLIFDTLVCFLGSFRLWKTAAEGSSRVSKVLLTDGLIYYITAVTVQALNLAFLLDTNPATQGTFLTFQTITTAILGQRIITSLSERTTSTPSSHNESSRTRDRSGSRGRGIWATSVRPPALVNAVRGPVTTDRVEMMKIEVSTNTHVHGDDESIEKKPVEYVQ